MPPKKTTSKKKTSTPASAIDASTLLAPVPFRTQLLKGWRKRLKQAARLPIFHRPPCPSPPSSSTTRLSPKQVQRLQRLLPIADPLQAKALQRLLKFKKGENPLHRRARLHRWINASPTVPLLLSALLLFTPLRT